MLPEQFRRRLFWKCLHRRAIPLAPAVALFGGKYFEADRRFIEAVGRAYTMARVWEEVREYFLSPRNQGWLRRRANLRLSARRVLTAAGQYLSPLGKDFRPFDGRS